MSSAKTSKLTTQANAIARAHGLGANIFYSTANPADNFADDIEANVRWLSDAYADAVEWRREESELLAAYQKRLARVEEKVQALLQRIEDSEGDK